MNLLESINAPSEKKNSLVSDGISKECEHTLPTKKLNFSENKLTLKLYSQMN